MANISADELQSSLSGADFPATKQELLDQARANGASTDVITTLENLPEKTYDAVSEVQEAFAKAEA